MKPDGARFEITGTLSQARVPPSRKCVFLEVTETQQGDRGDKSTRHDLIAFKVALLGQFRQGDRVTVTGRLSRTQVRDAKRKANDGKEYDVWTPQLVVEAISDANEPRETKSAQARPTAQARRPEPQPEPGAPLDDDGIPF